MQSIRDAHVIFALCTTPYLDPARWSNISGLEVQGPRVRGKAELSLAIMSGHSHYILHPDILEDVFKSKCFSPSPHSVHGWWYQILTARLGNSF